MLYITQALAFGYTLRAPMPRMMADAATDAAFGASHTSMYTDAIAKDSYETLQDVLEVKMADKELRSVLYTMFDGCGTITEALRKELVTVAEKQASVFGDVQLGVDVLADDLMWDICKTEPLIKEGASEEEPEVREMNADGKFCVCCTRQPRLEPRGHFPSLCFTSCSRALARTRTRSQGTRSTARASSTTTGQSAPSSASGRRRLASSEPPAATRWPPLSPCTAHAPLSSSLSTTACTSSPVRPTPPPPIRPTSTRERATSSC